MICSIEKLTIFALSIQDCKTFHNKAISRRVLSPAYSVGLFLFPKGHNKDYSVVKTSSSGRFRSPRLFLPKSYRYPSIQSYNRAKNTAHLFQNMKRCCFFSIFAQKSNVYEKLRHI